MLLIIYILLLIFISFLIRRKEENAKAIARLVYNLVFISGTQGIISAIGMSRSAEEVFNIFSESLYSAALGMTFNGDLGWAETMSVSFRAQMWMIIFIASVMTVESVLAAFFGRFVAQSRLKLKGSFKKSQIILVGSTGDAELLTEDIRKKVKNPYIIFIPTGTLEDDSALYGKFRIEKPEYLRRLKKKKDYRIVLLPDSGLKNMDMLYQLNDTYRDGESIHVTAFLDNDIIRFQDIHTDNIDACVLSAEQLLIYKFFDERSPIDVLKENHAFAENVPLPYLEKPLEICVIGFGRIGKEFLLYSFENSAFLTKDNSDSFHALVIDENMSVKKEDFIVNVPYFENANQIEFVDASIGSSDYYSAVKNQIHKLSQILITTGDTQLNIKTAINLYRFCDRMGIYTEKPEIIVILNESLDGAHNLLGQYNNIKIIDVSKQIINYETLIERKTDATAKTINEQYNKNSGSGKEWNKLGTFIQTSNRAVIRDEHNKKALYEMCCADKEKTLDFLAQYEHSRWNAFYHAHGWKMMSVDDLTNEEKACFVTKHASEKRHICLVDWDKLDSLPQKTPGLLKYYDMENVKQALEIDK